MHRPRPSLPRHPDTLDLPFDFDDADTLPEFALPLVARRSTPRRTRLVAALATLAVAAVAGCLGAQHFRPLHPHVARAPARPRVVAAAPRAPAPTPPAAPATVAWPLDASPNPRASLRRAWRLAEGRPHAHEILFTFDDGPCPGITEDVLDLLDGAHAHAAFFVVGERLEGTSAQATRSRELLRTIAARGHTIGNHSMTHPRLSTLTADRVAFQIDRTDELIEDATGERPWLFRPPFGDYGARVRRHVLATGHEVWLWSVDPQDWAHVDDADAVARAAIEGLVQGDGGTVILHDIHPWTVPALRQILAWITTENARRTAAGEAPYRIVDAPAFLADAATRTHRAPATAVGG